MERNTSGRIVSNTVFNMVGNLWKVLIGLALTPYIIGHIGLDLYGIWAIVSVVSGYFGLLDFGVGASFVKYISEFYTKKEPRKINQLVNTGIVFYAVFSLFIIALAYVALDPVVDLLNVPASLHSQAYFVFFVGIILFGVTSIFSAFGAIQNGLQRMDLTNKISILVSIPMVAGTVYFLENGYGLNGLMVNNAIVIVLTCIINFIVAFRLLPSLRINPLLASREMFRKIFSFGYKIQVGNISDTVTFQADKLLVSYFLNIGSVGIYQLGSSIAQTFRGIPILLISAILPAASEINAKKEYDVLKELYVRGTKYLILLSFPITFFTVVTADIIMRIWMGPGFETSAFIIQLLSIGYLFNIICGVAVSIGSAIEKPGYQMNASIITIVMNIVLSVILIMRYGLPGIAVAASISLVSGSIYYLIVFHREMMMPLRDLIQGVIAWPLVAAVVPAVLVYALNAWTGWAQPAGGRLENLAVFILYGMIYVAIYAAIILKGMRLDEYDLGLVKKYASVDGILGLFKVQ
jgi:O-antigen/teichoic acid export membrane protein